MGSKSKIFKASRVAGGRLLNLPTSRQPTEGIPQMPCFPLHFPPKFRRPGDSHGLTQVVDHLVPNQVRGSFESLGESEGEVFCFQMFSKACKSLFRRRFKKLEEAPLAAYYFRDTVTSKTSRSPAGLLSGLRLASHFSQSPVNRTNESSRSEFSIGTSLDHVMNLQ